MRHPFVQLLLRWSILALGVTIATKVLPGIRCDDPATLIVVVVLLSFLNAILKPLLVLFTLPFIIFTLGFGIVLINAILFLLVGRLVDGFEVASFWTAIGGALIVSVTSLVANSLLGSAAGGKPPRDRSGRGGPPRRGGGGDVIDV